MSKQKQQPALTPISYHPRSQEHQELIEQARRLEMLSIGFMISVVTLMYLASGNSQSMKTALLEDVLSLIPPAAFLLGHRWSQKKPTPWFCFGFQRTVLIAYLTAAVALLGLGSFAVIDSAINLLTAHKPTLGSMVFQGQVVWQGWVMLVVLLYSAIPLVILGHKKSKLAKKLGDDVLMADAATNKADWMTGLAAAVGVIGLGFGIWWLDSVMALLIALDIVRDGTVYLKNAVGKLMDRAPSVVGDFDKPHPLIGKIREKILQFGKGDLCELRVRSLGRYVTGQ
ncbi:MAG: cation transporter, partial [Vulcanimicrobiota bacterium]